MKPEYESPVVCIGLSAGGIEPLREIFRRLPPKTGITYVVIPHLSRNAPIGLPWLLKEWSGISCSVVHLRLPIEPDHIYIVPPNRDVTIQDAHFEVRNRSKTYGWPNIITIFLDSLVKSRHHPRIAVILSGMDSDGAAALRPLHDAGGIVIAQDLTSAQCKDMPESAIQTNSVDYVLSPQYIAEKILSLAAKAPKDNGNKRGPAGNHADVQHR